MTTFALVAYIVGQVYIVDSGLTFEDCLAAIDHAEALGVLNERIELVCETE